MPWTVQPRVTRIVLQGLERTMRGRTLKFVFFWGFFLLGSVSYAQSITVSLSGGSANEFRGLWRRDFIGTGGSLFLGSTRQTAIWPFLCSLSTIPTTALRSSYDRFRNTNRSYVYGVFAVELDQ